jgi:hydrogenase-4 component E
LIRDPLPRHAPGRSPREVEPSIGLLPPFWALATALAVVFGGRLPYAETQLALPWCRRRWRRSSPAYPADDAARRRSPGAHTGLENGIFLFGLLLVHAMPFLVEAGVLLDIFVGIFVSTIIIHHINREFASLDTRRLTLLKE